MSGATPVDFPWTVFALGEALIIAGFFSFFQVAMNPGSNIETVASKLE